MATEAKKVTEKPVEKSVEKTLEKTVKIKIPKTREETSDVYVSVNDRDWLIQRGVEVEVPECVAEVLEHREKMLEIAYSYEDSKKSE